MRRLPISWLFLIVALLTLVSCETTESFKRSITSRVGSMTSGVDENLFAQVPGHEKDEVDKAALALIVIEEKVRLAELKTELATLEKRYAGYGEHLTRNLQQEAALGLDIAKLEAIDRSGLGDKDYNTKKISDLKSKRLGMEAQRAKIETQLATAKRQISDLAKRIEEQEEGIEVLEPGQEQKGKDIEGMETGEGELHQ
jgi:chromosome segregation ATPase